MPPSPRTSHPSAGAPGQPAIANLPPELANNPQYEIVRELGRGGMGVVYLAKNKMMERFEVLKVINKTLLDQPGAVERFLREIRSAAKLSHANVVTAYSVVQQGELLAFAMEYVEGQDLAGLVKSQGALPVSHACFYVQQAAWGLQHAFEKGMVHRDIKPQNLILAREDKRHIVKVLDFGLAKATREKRDDAGLTGEGKMLGTPDYIAPEQTLDAAKADIRADIYSLGCTLYYLLAGRPPFGGASLGAILLAHQMQEAKSLNLVRPEVPEELAAVVRKMMAKSPAQRYQTPLEVVQALGSFVKQATTSKASPELGSSAVEAKSSVKLAPPVAPPQIPPADEAKKSETAAVWESLTDRSPTSIVSKKSGAAGRQRVATERERTAPRKWLMGGGIALGVLLLTLLGMWASGMFQGKVKVKTEDGILVLEVNEPNPVVLVDGQTVTVSWLNGGRKAEIRVRPGSHKVEIQKDGFSVDGKELTFKDGDRVVFTARLLPQEREAETYIVPPEKPPALNPPAVDTPLRTAQPNDYDALAKGRWVALLPSAEVFNRLLAENAYDGNEPRFVDGVLDCNGPSYLHFPSIKAKDVIVRAWIKRSGPKHGGNVGFSFRYANGHGIGTGFNGDGYFYIGRMTNQGWRDYSHCQLSEPYDDFFEFAFAVVGDKLIVYANGRKILEARGDILLDSIEEIRAGSNRMRDGQFRNIEMQVLDKSPVEAKGPVEEEGFVPLFNGKDLTGWKTHPSQPGGWSVEDGCLVGRSSTKNHLFSTRGDYEDFHLKAEASINKFGNSGIWFRSNFGLPRGGVLPAAYCAQILNSYPKPDAQLTGSLYGFSSVQKTLVMPDEWFTLEILAESNRINIKVNGKTTVAFQDKDHTYRKGHLVLKAMSDEVVKVTTIVRFRKIVMKELPAVPSSDRSGDSVSPEAKEVPKAYEKGCAEARAKLLADFDLALNRLAKMKGSTEQRLKLIEAVKEERKRFEDNGLIPWSAPMRPYVDVYLKSLGAEQGKLSRHYESLIDAQLRAKNDSKAAELREERKNRLDIRVLAKWRFFFNGKEGDHQTLYSDGTFSNGKPNNLGSSTWRYDKGVLTVISPSRNAPGGSWINILKLSEDGTEFDGANNNRPPHKVSGVYLKDN
ncbi:MAG TPA: family 16 glycoside hydrolase [Gemmataceae bacterium]|jgi:serine/threonine protein kinase